MRSEAKVQTDFREKLSALGIDTVKIHGSEYQRDLPDLLLVHKLTRSYMFVEVKAEGQKPTPGQRRFLSRVSPAHWVEISARQGGRAFANQVDKMGCDSVQFDGSLDGYVVYLSTLLTPASNG